MAIHKPQSTNSSRQQHLCSNSLQAPVGSKGRNLWHSQAVHLSQRRETLQQKPPARSQKARQLRLGRGRAA